jgi:hypothetical protein
MAWCVDWERGGWGRSKAPPLPFVPQGKRNGAGYTAKNRRAKALRYTINSNGPEKDRCAG